MRLGGPYAQESPPWIHCPPRHSFPRDRTLRREIGIHASAASLFPSLSHGDQILIELLINRGLLSVEEAHSAQVYCDEHNRDLRQAILELNLISPDLLNQLAFERLSALATDNGDPKRSVAVAAATAGTLSPNRTQHHRDVRKDLQEKVQTATLSELVDQILERACDCEATDIHFDPQESGLRVRFRIDGQLQDILFVEPAMATPVISRHQDHLEPEHRRAQAFPGRPHHDPAP